MVVLPILASGFFASGFLCVPLNAIRALGTSAAART